MKIISIGCSFTAGLGVLQEESYTSQLSKYIKCSNNNWGAAGHSNQYIFRKTIEILEKWNNDDILIIQWTNPNRDEIITNEGYLFYPPYTYWCDLSFLYGRNPEPGLKKAGIYDKDTFEKEIIKNKQNFVLEYANNFYNKDYQNILSFCFQYSLYGLLKNLNIKFIMFFGWEFEYYKKEILSLTDDTFLKVNFGTYTNTIGNEHPNAEQHKIWADFLYEKIKQFNYI
jgi:hypothetical protein